MITIEQACAAYCKTCDYKIYACIGQSSRKCAAYNEFKEKLQAYESRESHTDAD